MTSWFYSDPHFGHANIVRHASRPFTDVHEMDAELERRYADRVGPNDVVWWLGDVSFADDLWTADLLRRLPGCKMLVRGNHDGSVARCLRLGFSIVADRLHMTIAGQKVTVCHYPPASAPVAPTRTPRRLPQDRYLERRPPAPLSGEFVLHGHTHEKQRRVGRRIHVGVDAWDFRPVSLQEVQDLMVAS